MTESRREVQHPPPGFHDAHVMMQYPVQGMGMPFEYSREGEWYGGGYVSVQEQRGYDRRYEGQVWT